VGRVGVGIDPSVLDLGVIVGCTLALGRSQQLMELLFRPDTDSFLAKEAALVLELGEERGRLGCRLR
jgi:hypothetical protein